MNNWERSGEWSDAEEVKITHSTSSPSVPDKLREQVQKFTHRDRWIKGAGVETYTQI